MIILVTLSVFLAISLVTLAFFWWMEVRKESLPRRFREILSPSGGSLEGASGIAQGWFTGFRKRLQTRIPREEELVSLLSGKEISGARTLLSQAGYRTPTAYPVYFWAKAGLPLFLAVFSFVYGKAMGLPDRAIFAMAAMGLIGGFVLPDLFLRGRIRRRQEVITDSLPDGLDLLVVCVEAGLGLNASFVKITEEFRLSSPVLSEEFDIVNREMVAGKPRQEALRALAERTGVEEIKSLVAMLVQTEKLGTSLAQSLRVHSDSLRTRRRQRAEEAAAKTTIKLVFPLVFLLFPALFIVLLGPGAIQIIRILQPIMQK